MIFNAMQKLCFSATEIGFIYTFQFINLADAFIKSVLQIRKATYPRKHEKCCNLKFLNCSQKFRTEMKVGGNSGGKREKKIINKRQ